MEITERYYYTLGDVLRLHSATVNGKTEKLFDPFAYYYTLNSDTNGFIKGWGSMIQCYVLQDLGLTPAYDKSVLESDEITDLIGLYISPKCWYCNLIVSDVDDSAVLEPISPELGLNVSNDIKSFVSRVAAWLMGTYPKYKKLLDLYKAQETKLMDKLTTNTSGKTRFNDMPQSPIAAGDIEGDDHLTNLTKDENESSTDPSTPMMRLAEIQANYKNVYLDWLDEFTKTFIIM